MKVNLASQKSLIVWGEGVETGEGRRGLIVWGLNGFHLVKLQVFPLANVSLSPPLALLFSFLQPPSSSSPLLLIRDVVRIFFPLNVTQKKID